MRRPNLDTGHRAWYISPMTINATENPFTGPTNIRFFGKDHPVPKVGDIKDTKNFGKLKVTHVQEETNAIEGGFYTVEPVTV
jgi:hypothetical protein